MLIAIEDIGSDIVQVDACYRILDTTFGQSGTYRILISTKDIEAYQPSNPDVPHQRRLDGVCYGYDVVCGCPS